MREIKIVPVGKKRLLAVNSEFELVIITYSLEAFAKIRAEKERKSRRTPMVAVLHKGRWAIAEA